MKKQLGGVMVAGVLVASAPAYAEQGDWLVRARAITLIPDASSSPVAGLDVSTEATGEVDVTYFVTKNLGIELLAATKRFDVSLGGAKLGTVKLLPPTLTLQYHFAPEAKWRPYVSLGVNYTRFIDTDLGGLTVDKNSWGVAVGGGIDVEVTKHAFVNLDVKRIELGTDVKTATGAFVTNLAIDPVIVGVGVGWRF